MPLVSCPDCGRQVSDQAAACPQCGYPIRETLRRAGPETVLKEVSPALFGANPFMHLFVVILCFVIVGLVWYLLEYVRTRAIRLTVTNERTILRRGILSKQTNEVRHDDIRNIQVHQTFWGRLVNVGHLELSSAGQGNIEITVKGVPDPQDIARTIREYQ